MFNSGFAKNLHKRLFKLTDNFGWLRKAAESKEAERPSVVVNLPTISEFLTALSIEGDLSTTSEDDPKQAKLNHVVALALDNFYKNNLDLTKTAFVSWQFADVDGSLVKDLVFFDTDDLDDLQSFAADHAEDSDIAELIDDKEKLRDAVKYVLTRAYLSAYTIMVARNPVVAILNLMTSVNDQALPLSLNISKSIDGKIVAEAAKKDEEKESVFKVPTPRGPRLSDWIRSLRISRSQVLTSLQTELGKKQFVESKVSMLKVQYLILSSHISHLESIATAWKDLAKDDQFKASKLGSVFVMDDPPIGDLLGSDVSSIDALSGFLPPSVYKAFDIGPGRLRVKKWDGTSFSSISRDDFGEKVKLDDVFDDNFKKLLDIMNSVEADLPDSPELSNIKQKLANYSQTTQSMKTTLESLVDNLEDSKSKASFQKTAREFKDTVQSVRVILSDLRSMYGYDVDMPLVESVSTALYESLPRMTEGALNFIPPAAYIKQVYLPSVTTKPDFHSKMYIEALKDAKHMLDFQISAVPTIMPEQRKALSDYMGINLASAENVARDIYKEGFAKTLSVLDALPLDSLSDEDAAKASSAYLSAMSSIKSDLYSKYANFGARPIPQELFYGVVDALWAKFPRFGSTEGKASLGDIIKQIGGSAIAARTPRGSSQDFIDVYSKLFIKRQEPGTDSYLGSALTAVDRLQSDYFYGFYDDHVKKHEAWKDNYSTLGADEEAQESRKNVIKSHYDEILKSDILKKLDLNMPRGGSLIDYQNPVNPKNDEKRLAYLSNVQKFLREHPTLDSIYAKIDSLDANVSMESVLVYIGVELVEAFEPELVLYLAASYPKVTIRGVETGFGYSEKWGEDEASRSPGSGTVGTLTYRDLNSDIPRIEYAKAFIEKFKQDLRFNSRAIGQLHPYTPGGMIADIYYIEERKSKLPTEDARKRRSKEIERFKTEPLGLLGYIKKRLYDSYGKSIYDRNQDQLSRVLVNASKTSDKPNVATNLKQFMHKVGAFADPQWSIQSAANKANYRYVESLGDSASVHLHRAFNRVGQISALSNNYDTVFSVYKAYFDSKKEELLRIKDKSGKSIWKDYIIPYDINRDQETNEPFSGILPELAKVAATATVDTSTPSDKEAVTDESAILDNPDMVSLLITDRKSAIDAIGSLKTSLISDIDRSMIKGIVSNLGRKDPKIYTDPAKFMTALIAEIRKETALGNREDTAQYFENYVSVVVEQAQKAAPLIKAIQTQEDIIGPAELSALRLKGEALLRANVPTGYSNLEYLRQKIQYTIDSISEWYLQYEDANLKHNLDDYIPTINSIVSGAGKTFDQFKNDFNRLSDRQRTEFNVPTFGSYVAYYRLYVEAQPQIEAEETYPDFSEFLEMQDDYLQNYAQLGEKLNEYVNEYRNISLLMFNEVINVIKLIPQLNKVKASFEQQLKGLDDLETLDPEAAKSKAAVDKWKADVQAAVQRHKTELDTSQIGEVPLSSTRVIEEEPDEEPSEVTPLTDEVEEISEVEEEDPFGEKTEEISLTEIAPAEPDVTEMISEDEIEPIDQLSGLQQVAKSLQDMVTSNAVNDWLDTNASTQKSELIGNISNLADTLSKLTENSFDSIDNLPKFEDAIRDVVTKASSNLSRVPEIFSDTSVRRLVENAAKMFGVDLSEMPLAPSPAATVPLSIDLPGATPSINTKALKEAVQILEKKVQLVEGDVSNMAAAQDTLEQLTGNVLSEEQAATVVSNTKTLLDYLNSLTEKDFKDQAGLDKLVKTIVIPLSNGSAQDFVRWFSAEKFPSLFEGIRTQFGVTKSASRKLAFTVSPKNAGEYTLHVAEETDEGYYF